jgi:hypothetical protein
LKENSQGPLSIIVDSLTDFALNESHDSGAYKQMYNFVQHALEILDDPRFTVVFLLNPSAHDPKDIASVRGIFNNQLICEKSGVALARVG